MAVTGKTEFCKVLAERLGASLYGVGKFDDKGDEPMRGERLPELRLAQRLLAGHGGSLLLFDEMEDLLSDPFPAWGLFGPHSRMAFRNTGSKVFMHRLLEAAPTPTLWTRRTTGASSTPSDPARPSASRMASCFRTSRHAARTSPTTST